ncbi:FMN-linked oxidoreductase [Hesseltinella vesiculosa]|uniref:FMN-linked oxidoreductase n=1 Tax=Hesseltinella vesiculosa TaxID=101127 RepID=A0A1X2G5Y8_9FUNG|nr:FMN-linked oxidoreductase [Hesseltinella vesiculosa]
MTFDYYNKVFLAPMVRVGTLPMRLLALEYGADLVWTEELVDKRIIGSVRKFNPATGATEYWKGKALCFATHPDERGKVILQLGTACPDMALEAALTLQDDIAGVDLNCGCPIKFSVQGGMGAALLADPDRLIAILEKLVNNLHVPVTCKIRILEEEAQTVALAKRIEATGVKNLTVHCRTRGQRSSVPARWDCLNAVTKAITSIPVTVNGDVYTLEDAAKAKAATNADSAMIARGAIQNASAFRKEGPLPYKQVATEYLKKSVLVENMFANTKYVMLSMNTDDSTHTRSDFYKSMQSTKTMKGFCELFDLGSFYDDTVKEQQRIHNESADVNQQNGTKREAPESATSDHVKKAKTDPQDSLPSSITA